MLPHLIRTCDTKHVFQREIFYFCLWKYNYCGSDFCTLLHFCRFFTYCYCSEQKYKCHRLLYGTNPIHVLDTRFTHLENLNISERFAYYHASNHIRYFLKNCMWMLLAVSINKDFILFHSRNL